MGLYRPLTHNSSCPSSQKFSPSLKSSRVTSNIALYIETERFHDVADLRIRFKVRRYVLESPALQVLFPRFQQREM